MTKLTAPDIPAIRGLYRDGSTLAEIARSYGVDRTTVLKVLRGRTWGHIPDPAGPVVMRSMGPRGRRAARARVTESEVGEIRARYRAGAKIADLATAFGLARGGIWHIVRRKTWRHID